MSSQRPMSYSDLIDAYAKRDNTDDFEFRNNTVFQYGELYDGDPYFELVLYGEVIATLYEDCIYIAKDLPHTNTTKNRLNDVLIPIGWRVRQIAGEWKLFPEGHSASVRDFFGGMSIATNI